MGPAPVGLVVAGVACALLWVRTELRHPKPLVDLSVLRNRVVRYINTPTVGLGWGRFAGLLESVATAAAALPEDYAPLARLLLRAEGIASSYVEGVCAPVVEVVLAEHDPSGQRSPAAWVAANLQASTAAVRHASGAELLTLGELCCWHTALMAGSPTLAEHVGHVPDRAGLDRRDEPVGCSPGERTGRRARHISG
ncbi:MAG: Fic family protein [Mycobacteriales bacterium]